MQPTVEHLLEEISRHHLMPSREWGAMRERWLRPGRKGVADVPVFCRWLAVNDYLTELQVRYLVKGRAELLRLGEYRIRDRITRGPNAGALLADDGLGRQVVVEVLAPPVAESVAAVTSIQQIVTKLARQGHPNLGRILGMGTAHEQVYLVKEPYKGETLASVLQRRGRLRPGPALRLFGFALATLQALHEQGIPGGELSPECLLLTASRGEQGREVKLLHAGLRRRLFDSSELLRGAGAAVDEEALPTASFVVEPVEKARPEEDLFRLGCVFYLTLTGQSPFAAAELPEPARRAEPVRRLAPAVPDMLADLVERMIDPQPVNRPATAGDAARTVRIILAAEEEDKVTRPEENLPLPSAIPSKSAEEPPWPAKKRKKKKRPVPAAAGETEDRTVGAVRAQGRLGLPREAWQGAPLFAAAGACLFLTAVVLLQLFTGWELVNLVCLLAGASFSFLAEQLLQRQSRAG